MEEKSLSWWGDVTTSNKDEVIKKESLWKRKLFSKEYGYNRN